MPGAVIVGTDGQVTWTTIGNAVSHVESFAIRIEADKVVITDFNTSGWENVTAGIRRASGTIVCNARTGYAPVLPGPTIAVLTLDTAETGEGDVQQYTGSGMLESLDAGRENSSTPSQITYAFVSHGAWAVSNPTI